MCTEPDSTLGQIVAESGGSICRYTAVGDFRQTATWEAALLDVRRFPGAHIMASIPCTAGSLWQKLNLKRGGERQRLRVSGLRCYMVLLGGNLRLLARAVRGSVGTISFEWPRHCSLWREPIVHAFVEEFQLRAVDFDGCAVGLVHPVSGLPLLKLWRVYTGARGTIHMELFPGATRPKRRVIPDHCAFYSMRDSLSQCVSKTQLSRPVLLSSLPLQICPTLQQPAC